MAAKVVVGAEFWKVLSRKVYTSSVTSSDQVVHFFLKGQLIDRIEKDSNLNGE
jgi:hypothetical protein